MSRSRRKTRIHKIAGCSDKRSKRRAHKSMRAAERQAAAHDLELWPEMREVSNVYNFDSDGKRWLRSDDPRWIRK